MMEGIPDINQEIDPRNRERKANNIIHGRPSDEGIPESEQVDMSISPISQEDIDAEFRRMQEAVAEGNELLEGNQEHNAQIPEAKAVAQERAKKLTPQELRETILSDRKHSKLSEQERKEREAIEIEKIREVMRVGVKERVNRDVGDKKQGDTDVPPEVPRDGDDGDDGGDGEEDLGSTILHEGRAEFNRKICEKCHGKGSRFLFFVCGACHGSGSIVVSQKMNWSDKVIKRKKPTDSEILPEIPPQSEK